MTAPDTGRIPYLIEDEPGQYRVGTKIEVPFREDPYIGPCAHVYVDYDYLHISSDDYDGHATIRIEALPMMIEALQKLQTFMANKMLKT